MTELQTGTLTVKELLQIKNIAIPTYQRPYKWTAKNVNQLIDDIIYHKDKSAYRLGTLVIHEDKDEFIIVDGQEKTTLNIVDGQQRTLTLTLIAFAITTQNNTEELKKIYKRNEGIDNYKPELTNLEISNDISKANIQNNYKIIERRIKDFDEKTIRFFFEKCELVKVVLSDITEAFQFFDSQNARGKDLEPHDLLKAYHLREMNNFSTEAERIKSVEEWEEMDTDKLSQLFALYLYRIRNWSNGKSAKYFTKNEVDIFKGVSPGIQEEYPYARVYRIAHFYIDNYNKSYHRSIDENELKYPFQIDQTIINGKRFFEMITFYDNMIEEVRKMCDCEIFKTIKMRDCEIFKTINSYPGKNRTGDKYVRNLFDCGIIYYIDKFGKNEMQKVVEKIFVWAYTLRLKLSRVQLESIDNYALNKKHSQVHLFKIIKESIRPNDIMNMKLETLEENKSTKTNGILTLFKNMKYYEKSVNCKY